MTRPLRLEYENAIYHVMNRGINRREIYSGDEHRNAFLGIISQASCIFGIEILAWCLMKNHYHLLIKTPRGNLSRAMRHINGVYTQYYNRKEMRDGPLFRGRYKAILVEGDDYLLQVSRYIHLNPVSAHIVERPENYYWSSYRLYISSQPDFFLLKSDEILSIISRNSHDRVKAYQKFVEEGLDEKTKQFYKSEITPVILGTEERKKFLLEGIEKNTAIFYEVSPDYNRTCVVPSLKVVVRACAEFFDVDEKDILQPKRGKKNFTQKYCHVWWKGMGIRKAECDC